MPSILLFVRQELRSTFRQFSSYRRKTRLYFSSRRQVNEPCFEPNLAIPIQNQVSNFTGITKLSYRT